MYGEATRFYRDYPKDKCKYGTYLTRVWKGMRKETAITPYNYHCIGKHDKSGHTCPRCMEYKDYTHYYSSKGQKNGKDNICKDCRKRYAKFLWQHGNLKENQRIKRLALKSNSI